MIEEHISTLIFNQLNYEPTASQLKLIDAFGRFLALPDEENIMLIKGFAGTGKTSLVSAMVKVINEMEISTVLLAPTGRAAKVFSSFAGVPAFTIHKKIYRQKTSGDGFGSFALNWNSHKDTIFIVDEASMIADSLQEQSVFGSGRLLEDLFSYIFQGSNCKLIIIGDSAQLPPVGFAESPALDKQVLEHYGLKVNDFFLSEVVRQDEHSGILGNATAIRNGIEADESVFKLPLLKAKGTDDVRRIGGDELIQEISWCYDHYGVEETLVVCRSNKRAGLYNKGIRGSILYREEELVPGDWLMVVKNNYFWLAGNKDVDFIANGDILEVLKIRKYEEIYGYRFANVVLRLPDHHETEIEVKILLDTLGTDTGGFSMAEQQKFYNVVIEDYTEEKNRRKKLELMRQNPYYNALQVKYAYAMTCHKAQGGQWKAVFIDQGVVNEEDKGRDYLRWLYTALTRSTQRLYFVNFPDSQFKD